MGKGVRAVHHDVHTARMRHVADGANRKDLPGDVHHVWHQQQTRLRRDRVGVHLHHLGVRLGVRRNVDELVDHAEATCLQLEHVDHGAVVVVRHDRLVARLPVEAGDHRVERLGCVPRDDEFVGRATGHRGELRSHAKLVAHAHGPHVAGPLEIDGAHMVDERREHLFRLEAVVAVLEIDVVGLQLELRPDRRPELLVLGERSGGHVRIAREE